MLISKTKLFGGGIERILIHYGQFINGLAVTYLLENGERLSQTYGRLEGDESPEIVFEADERICAITVYHGYYVDSLAFITYRMFNLIGMKRYGPYGGAGGVGHTVLSPNIREFFGQAGWWLDAIGFRCEEPMFVC